MNSGIMRYVLVVFLGIEGVWHLGASGTGAKRLVFLALATALGLVAAGVLIRSSRWLQLLPIVVLASVVSCALSLPGAMAGFALNLVAVVLACTAIRFPGDIPAVRNIQLERFWESAPATPGPPFDGRLDPHLGHAIAPGTQLASATRIRMHGTIKLGPWFPFVAEEVIIAGRGMVWAGTASIFGLPVCGSDRSVDGVGEMDWRLFGLFPIARSSGSDTSKSALGRMVGETVVWLPSALAGPEPSVGDVEWIGEDDGQVRLLIDSSGLSTVFAVNRNSSGQVAAVSFPRWGNPDGGNHRFVDFGLVVERERTFHGYTVPSNIRAGWYFGTDRFAKDGEFFRAEIDGMKFL